MFGRRKKPAKLGMRRRTSFAWSNVAFPPPAPAGHSVEAPAPDPVAESAPEPIASTPPPAPDATAAPMPPPAEPVAPNPAPRPMRPTVAAAGQKLASEPVAEVLPPAPAGSRPTVRLGFVDGTSYELADSSGESKALRRVAAQLIDGPSA